MAFLAVLLHHIVYQIVLPEHWAGLWKPSGKIQVILAALLSFGASGVILFFLLSSFLLFLPFARALLFDGQWPSILRFYIRRFFRILPGYYVAIILLLLFFHPELLHSTNRWKVWEFFTFSMQAHVPEQLNGPFWTMAVEFQFYLLLPLIAWIFSFIVRRGTLRWRITKLVVCLLVVQGWGLLSRWWGLFIQPSATSFPQNILVALQPYYYGDNGKYFESFAVGMLLAMLYMYTQNAPKGEILRRKLQQWSSWMFLIGLLILGFLALYVFCVPNNSYGAAFAFLDPYRTMLSQIYAQWQSTGYSICYGLCMCALLYSAGWLKRPFEWPVLRWIGLFSFSLYMWHLPLLFLFMNIMSQQSQGVGHGVQFAALLAWVFFVIFPISLTLYRWIEMPGMRLGEMLIQKIETLEKGKATYTSTHTPIQEAPVEVKTS
ncbi:MAG: hypothetical protein NVSMB38_05370 [Ktedonobacteraceae bacterium]